MDTLRSLEGLSVLCPPDPTSLQRNYSNFLPQLQSQKNRKISDVIIPSLSNELTLSIPVVTRADSIPNNDNCDTNEYTLHYLRSISNCTLYEEKSCTPRFRLLSSNSLYDENCDVHHELLTKIKTNDKVIRIDQFQQQPEVLINSNDFIIMDTLGTGGSYVVQKAFHIPSCKIVAIKSSRNNWNIDIMKQVQTDIEILNKFKNNDKNIVNIILHGKSTQQNTMKIILEYMHGGTLKNFIQSESVKYDICDENKIRYIAKSILLGLNELHKENLIHNDIKPANILYNNKGNIKLSDFGIVQKMESKSDLKTKDSGSEKYNSPEKSSYSNIKYNTKTDIWSFGLAMYEVCNLEFIKESNPVKLCDNVPKLNNKLFSIECCDFISKCLIVDHNKRWSVDELLKHPFLNNTQKVNLMDIESRKRKNDLNFIVSELIKYYSSRHFTDNNARDDNEYSDKVRINNISSDTGYSIKEVEREIKRQVILFIENIKKSPTTLHNC